MSVSNPEHDDGGGCPKSVDRAGLLTVHQMGKNKRSAGSSSSTPHSGKNRGRGPTKGKQKGRWSNVDDRKSTKDEDGRPESAIDEVSAPENVSGSEGQHSYLRLHHIICDERNRGGT